MMGAGSKTVTVGYKYRLGLHLIFSAGPVDALLEIRGGDRVAWSGTVTSSQRISINAPDLYGGDEREGGIVGEVDVMMGTAAQAPNDYLQSVQGAPQPAYRGLFGLVFRRCQLASNNPYLKAIAARARRITAGWQGGTAWYAAKASIDVGGGLLAANPAHIVYECLTNAEWGMGYSAGLINGVNFQAAADTFHGEGLGLCMQWLRQEPIEEFVRIVLDHAGANLVQDRRTGLFELRLIRGGYNVAALPLFDEDNILQLVSFERPAITDAVNEITVQFDDAATGRQGSIAVQNLANVTAQGGVVTQGRNYPGAPTAAIASRLGMRDLRAISSPLARVRLRTDRSAWAMQPGEVFRLSWARLGVEQLCMRVAKVDLGTLTDGTIEIEAIEDVFGMPSASYAAQQPIGWTDPRTPPAAALARVVREATYYELQLELGAAAADVPADAGYIVAAAARPSSDSMDFALATRVGAAAYEERARGPFAPAGQLSAQLGPAATSATVTGVSSSALIAAGTYAQIGQEIVRVDTYNAATGAITIGRGVCGTVARTHAAGAWVLFLGDFLASEGVERIEGQDVDVKLLPRTGMGQLQVGLAPADTLEMAGAAARPYPPGRLRINGQAYPETAADRISAAWAHRNRLAQNLEGDESGNIGPELGTTYTAQLLLGGAVQAQQAAIAGTAWSVVPAAPGTYTLRVSSQRDGLSSLQQHDVPIVYTGTASASVEPNLRAAFQTSRDIYSGSVWWRFILPDTDYIDIVAEGSSGIFGNHAIRKYTSAGVQKGSAYAYKVNAAAFDESTGLFMVSLQKLAGTSFWQSRLWVFNAASSLNTSGVFVGPGGGARLDMLSDFANVEDPIWSDMAAGHIVSTNYLGSEIKKYNATTGALVQSLSASVGVRPQTDGTSIVLTLGSSVQVRAFSDLSLSNTISLPWSTQRAHLLGGSVIATTTAEARRYSTAGVLQGTMTGITDPANVPEVRAQKWGRYVAIGNGNGAVFDTLAGWAPVPDSSYVPPP